MSKGKPPHKKKLDGSTKMWVCSCGVPYCDSMYLSNKTFAGRKINKRNSLKLCIGCGHKDCTCKNKNRGNFR